MTSSSDRPNLGWMTSKRARQLYSTLIVERDSLRDELELRVVDFRNCQEARVNAEERLAATIEENEILKAKAEIDVVQRIDAFTTNESNRVEIDALNQKLEASNNELLSVSRRHEVCRIELDKLKNIRSSLILARKQRDNFHSELLKTKLEWDLSKQEHERELHIRDNDISESAKAYEMTCSNLNDRNLELEHQLTLTEAKITKLESEICEVRGETYRLREENQTLRTKLEAPNISFNVAPLHQIDERFAFLETLPENAKATTEKCHIVIPVHRPKITHISNMFGKIMDFDGVRQNLKIRFIATTEEEKYEIENYIAICKPNIPATYEIVSASSILKHLGFQRVLDVVLGNMHNSNINIKKIIGIYTSLLEGAEEIITLDMDVVFFSDPSAIFAKSRENFKKKKFFAAYTTSDLMRDIVITSADYFSPYDKLILMSKMRNASIYSWFYDVPYYPKIEVSLFISHIQSLYQGFENSLLALSWHSFDHILFMYFLTLHAGFEMIDVRSDIIEIESSDNLSITDILRIRERHDYSPIWATLPSMIKADAEILQEFDFSVAIHADRLS